MGIRNTSARSKSRRSKVCNFRPELLEGRELLTVALDPINAVSVPASKTLFVPVHGTDSSGNPINYSVTSSNSQVSATVRSGHTYLKLTVANYGDMVFQLFDDLAPNTVSEITKLVDQNFYNGLTFHRIVSNFVIQGGDPKGDGTGGPGFTFPNEFNANAIFDGSGQLAMANSGPNTNGSQFFVTVGPQRFLDFNYNLFGQIVSGQSVLQAIDAVPTNSNSKPLTPVTITNASIIQDTSDTVLMIQAPAGAGSSTITVTGTDSVDHSTQSETFQANYQADTTVDPPFLNPTPADQTTTTGTPLTFALSSTDLQNNPVTYSATESDSLNNATIQVSGNQVTVTPKAGFTGTIPLQVGVQQTGATSRGSTSNPNDLRTLNVSVTPAVVTTPTPSLSMKIIPSASRVQVGHNVSYAIEITNTGKAIASGVVLTDALSGGASFISSTNTPSATSGSNITIPVGDIPVGAVATIIVQESPTAAGTFTSKFTATTSTNVSVNQTETATGSTQAVHGFGGGVFDNSIAYINAPAGVSQHAINLTSHTFSQIMSGHHHGWDGLYTIMARFNRTGNLTRLESDLSRLAHHIPYGARNLLPAWLKTIQQNNLSSTTRDPNHKVTKLLQGDLISYLATHEGQDLNILKSHGSNGFDRLLTFNGRVS